MVSSINSLEQGTDKEIMNCLWTGVTILMIRHYGVGKN